MQQLESDRENIDQTGPNQTQEKPEPFVNWENEGGQVIPTGSLPRVILPEIQEEKIESGAEKS